MNRMHHQGVKGLLFDLDGTLLDTLGDLLASANHALALEGLPLCSSDEIRPQISGGARSMIGYWITKRLEDEEVRPYPAEYRLRPENQALLERVIDRMLDHYEAFPATYTRFFEGMEEVLAYLDAKDMPWGIVTNKRTRFTTPIAMSFGLDTRTPCIVSGDTTPKAKPHPLPLIKAAELLGLAPHECVYMGDAERDIEAGKRAGMRTLAAGYGYIAPQDCPENWGAEKILGRPADLIPWIEEYCR